MLVSHYLDTPESPFLSPLKVATTLSLQLQDLADSAHVHRNALAARPHSPKVQALLRSILRVVSATTEVFGDQDIALTWIRNEPVPAFRHKTALDLVLEGRAEDVVFYLESVSGGFVG
ncbi:MbcA/ParS/Xre antitoxin family protein [Oleiagrimonas sp. C23AA]|uniref:MbcA/ParS/Xre antitoxin family protein n=1 Tax=Oleiagrimonas sp. C23AA TaxID=2719047 RepID=UPI00141E3CE9|nr:MbcA/ParS/Xre antitoxin family protein [Oleiagrimonas sp. C23AA]NII10661.1 DUF2384 domain-containing protein [Oleiagrimonas sp. C23AA]